MTSPTLNSTEVKDVRSELSLPLYELIQLMQSKGWEYSLSFSQEFEPGYVAFQKPRDWNGISTLASKCRYGYLLPIGSTEEFIHFQTQRAAELCIRLLETFVDCVPGTPNIHGIIGVDLGRDNSLDYRDFQDRERDGYISKANYWVETSHPDSIVVEKRRKRFELTPDTVELLKKQLAHIDEKHAGLIAIDC